MLLLHRGRPQQAAQVLDTPPEQLKEWYNGMWRPWYAALWAATMGATAMVWPPE